MRYQGWLCVPNVDCLRNLILYEDHGSPYSNKPGSTKIYHELREVFWWEGFKENIAEIVAKSTNFQQVKDEHQKLGGLLKQILILSCKWQEINIDFVIVLPQTQKQYDTIWVVVDWLTNHLILFPSNLPIQYRIMIGSP